MTAGMVGADVEQLRRLARQFDAGATSLRQMSGALSAQIQATQAWQGADASRCRSEWSARHRVQLAQVADALHTASRVINQNAEEQQHASDGAGGSAGAVPGGVATLHHLSLAEVAAGGLATGMAGKKLWGIFSKSKALAAFLSKARGGLLGEAEDALKLFTQGAKDGGMLGRLGLGSLGKLAGKAFLPLTVVTGVWDGITGGGYDGARGWATRGFGLAGAAGAGALLASSAGLLALGPVGLGIAGGAVLAYGAWSAGNYVWDHREAIGHFFKGAYEWSSHAVSSAVGAVSSAGSAAAHAVSSTISSAGHALAGAGSSLVSGVTHLIPHISIL